MASSVQPFAQPSTPPSGDPPCDLSSPEYDGLPHSLEDLLNDCFQHAIDKDSLSSVRAACVEKFHHYVSELHCQENLSFIIEICRYRYYFEKRFPGRKLSDVGKSPSSYVNHSLDQLIQDLPEPTADAKKHHRRTSSRSQSNNSLNFSSGAPFDLEFDDVLGDKQNAWDYLTNQYVRDSDSDSDSDADLDDCDDESMVTHQWQYILDNFIYDKSPCQVNLTNQTFRSISDQAALKQKFNHPSVLLDAYCEVVALIHENAYNSFLMKLKECPIEHAALPSSVKSASPKPVDVGSCPVVTGSVPSSINSAMCCAEKMVHSCSNKSNSHMIAPVPNKRRSKFLSTFSSSSSSEVSPAPSTLGHWLGHLKPQSSSRVAYSAPQSPLSYPPESGETSPTFRVNDEVLIPRSRSTMVPEEGHSSFINKFWKKKK